MLCLWYSELETPCWHFSHKCLSGQTWNIPSWVGHGFTNAGAMKPNTWLFFAQGDEIQHFNMRHFFNAESFATEKRIALDCHDSRHLYKPSAGSCLHKPGHTKDEGWNYGLAVPHLKLQMKLVDLLKTGHLAKTRLTTGSSLQATQRSFSTPPFPLAEGRCFAYCGVSWKFVVGPCLRHFMQQQTAGEWVTCHDITFQPCRNHLVFNRI